MNLSQKIATIFLILILASCENYYSSSIINNTKSQIVVHVKMDQKAIEKWKSEYLKKGLLVGNEKRNDYEIKINPSESYELAGRLHSKPDFEEIKEIEIYSGDTLLLKCRKNQMQKLFSSELNSGTFDLVVE
jgi:hypothetical protein